MGAIQNSINGALGATAVAGRMISNEKEAALAHGDTAFQQNQTDKSEMEKLGSVKSKHGEIFDAKNKLDEAKTVADNLQDQVDYMYEDPNLTSLDRQHLEEDLGKALDDRKAAKKALSELKRKQKAIKERMARQETAMAKGRLWGGAY